MARKKKKKSLLLTGAGLAARIILEKRIIKKEQKRAAARAEGGRSALQARVKKPVLDEALYHALGGKASNDSLKLKAARKALKQKEASAAAVSAESESCIFTMQDSLSSLESSSCKTRFRVLMCDSIVIGLMP